MIDETELRSYLAELAQSVTSRLPSDEFEILFERLGATAITEHGLAVDWRQVIGGNAAANSKVDRHLPFKPFGLSIDDLATIDLALIDVVGANYRAYELLTRKPAIWTGFFLEGPRGRFRLEFWRCD